MNIGLGVLTWDAVDSCGSKSLSKSMEVSPATEIQHQMNGEPFDLNENGVNHKYVKAQRSIGGILVEWHSDDQHQTKIP